jgi:putative phage-type endonuclease
MIQGTAEWKQARCGSLGASRMADVIARTKTGYGASRANLMAELLVERLTGVPTEGFVSAAMQWGTDKEPHARAAYEFRSDVEVAEIGIVPHPTIKGTHASPDGLVGEDGLIEIKCPNTASHVETLTGDEIAGKYITQMQWQMACTGRKYCDFISFDPRMPESMSLFVRRVPRDDTVIAQLEAEARKFLTELDAKVSDLRQRYERKEAA